MAVVRTTRDVCDQPDFAADATLVSLFRAQVERVPDRVAVVCGRDSLTYAALDRRAERLARELAAAGVGPGALVGVFVAPSLDLIVAILGVLRAGGAYVPVDVESPKDRAAYVLHDAAVRVVVADRDRRGDLPPDIPIVTVPQAVDVGDADRTGTPPSDIRPTSLAYVIYTSGSTGRPKGVLVEHRSVVSLFRAASLLFDVGSDDVWTLCHSAAFDFSVWEIWGALLFGGRLIVVPRVVARSPDDLLALLDGEGVTVLSQTPTAFMELMRTDAARSGPRLLALRYVVFGGEALEFGKLRPWFAAHGDAPTRLINMYGITETTVHVTFRLVTSADAEDASGSLIGEPIPGWQLYLLDEGLRPVPAGEVAELCVGGDGVARGYLNRPELQAQRFVPNPFSAEPGATLYRSGDLGRQTPGGEIEYLGRADQQIKIRGFRIELGEIESALGQHDAVLLAVVALREDRGEKQLVAYWVPRPGASATAASLRSHLQAVLPSYMVPSAFVTLARLPMTVNGKLDRAALPAPTGARPDLTSEFVAPRTPLEAELASVWSDLLGIEPIGAYDNFFELGGHSLVVARMLGRMSAHAGVRLSVRDVFDQPTIAALAERIGAQRQAPSAPPPASTVVAGPATDGPAPMSPAQSGMWFLQQLVGWTHAYVLGEAWRLEGPVDVAALEHALTEVVTRHAPLRTRFGLLDGTPVQTVGAPVPCSIAVEDVSALEPAARLDAALGRVMEFADQPFDLAAGVLVRARLVKLAEADHLLVITTHHIVSDAWSQRVLHRDLSALYAALRHKAPSPLPPLPIQFVQAAARAEQALTPDRLATLYDFWTRELEGLSALDLPTDRARPALASDRGDECIVHVPADLTEALRRLGREQNASLHMVLLAAYELLLSTYSGQTDFAVATPTAGRSDADVEALIGLFVNFLVLRTDVSGDPSVRELVTRVRERSLNAYAHEDLPFDRLVARLKPARDTRQVPLAQVVFQLLARDDAPLMLEGLSVERLALRARRTRFDIEMTVVEVADGLRASLIFRADLFDEATMARFGQQFLAILRAFVSETDTRVSALSWLADDERRQQLEVWSGELTVRPQHRSVIDELEARTTRTPEATALVAGDRRMTYAQLWAQAGQLARRLETRGAGRGGRVAVCLDRSAELIVAMVAILRTGAAYVPLDPGYPDDRLLFMVRDAGITVVVTDDRCPAVVRGAVAQVLHVDEEEAGEHSDTSHARTPAPSDAAYVMYTSGSTGQPKGVVVPHRAIVRLVRDTDYVEFLPTDRVAFAASPSFDAATFEVWGALLNGATLVTLDRATVLSPVDLARAIKDRGLTVLFLTTALFHQMAHQAPDLFRPLRYLVAGGDVMDPIAARAVMQAGGPQHLVNGYGPTENTTFSTAFDVATTDEPFDTVPIGRPIRESTCYVLGDGRQLLPAGAIGELYVGGTGLADEYLNRPALTAERFVAHPFRPGARLYQTGDWVRWRHDGDLLFIGRRDRQIKLHGFRIELSEIEHALASHAAVRQCIVIVRRDGAVPRLVAYWVAADDRPVADEALQTHLGALLPEYMVPRTFVRLARLPTTENGKIDAAALPEPAQPGLQASGEGDPRSTLEVALVRLWAEALQRPSVGIYDDFFEIGGSSLLAISLAAKMERACGVPMSAATIFSFPTIARIAELFESARGDEASHNVIELRRGGSRPPLFFPPGLLGESAAIGRIVAHLPEDQPIYVIGLRSIRSQATPSMEELASRYVADLVATRPNGPICLAGHSFSGLMAFEMARQLRARGRDVRLVAIIDAGVPRPKTLRNRLLAVGYFLQNLPRWLRTDLQRLDSATRARLLRSAKSVLRRATNKRIGSPIAEEIFDVSRWPEDLVAQTNAGLRALEAYPFGTYDGRLLLLRATTWPLFHSHGRDFGWSSYVKGGLDIVDVPGNHFTITQEPQVGILASELGRALEVAARHG
jgi:amino acid adenylation domain-containing protein